MKKILVATDCTPISRSAIDFAAALARDFNAALLLLHVYHDITATEETTATTTLPLETALQQERTRLKMEYGIGAQPILKKGVKAAVIYDTAKEEQPDLLVMGRGSNKENLLWNSTSLQSMERTKTALLLVPEGVRFSSIKYTVLCTDYQLLNDVASLQPYLHLIERYHASVLLLHFRKEGKASAAEAAGREQITRVFTAATHWNQEISDDFDNGLQTFLRDHAADLLVMIAHKHSFVDRLFGTIHTRSVAKLPLDRPLLLLPDK